jgi:hypothetical protein
MPTLAGIIAGSGGSGTRILVLPITNGVGSPYTLSVAETGALITNEGASAKVYINLPSASAGLCYGFYIQDADGMRFTAATGNTIRSGDQISASAGYSESTSTGSMIWAIAINSTGWVCCGGTGIWTLT